MPVLNLRQTDDTGRVTRLALDTDADDFAPRFEEHLEAVREEAARPIQAQLTATAADLDASRGTVIGEILRVQQLEHVANAAAGDTEAFDAETERAFLETLTAPKLKLHFDRAMKSTAAAKPQTSGENPTADAPDAAYGNVTTA